MFMKKKLVCLVLTALMVLSIMPATAFAAQVKCERPLQFEENIATELKKLNLFKGVSETDFALRKVPTRIEALVIMLRLRGKESEILAGAYTHPFTDVPSWANNYVGYAYENGLTKGISASKFGTDNATDVQFLTFVLRALGYSDANGDFTWDNPYDLAEDLGVLDCSVTTGSGFLRADCASISYNALSANLRDGSGTLADKLIGDGVFTKSAYDAAVKAVPDYADFMKVFNMQDVTWTNYPKTDQQYFDNFRYCFIRGAWSFTDKLPDNMQWELKRNGKRAYSAFEYFAEKYESLLIEIKFGGILYCQNGKFYFYHDDFVPPYSPADVASHTFEAYNRVKSLAEELRASGKIVPGMTEKQIAEVYVDYLQGLDMKVAGDDASDMNRSIYAVLVKHIGICASCADTFSVMMNNEEIKNYTVEGTAGNDGHGVTYIILDNKEYYCDWWNHRGIYAIAVAAEREGFLVNRDDLVFVREKFGLGYLGVTGIPSLEEELKCYNKINNLPDILFEVRSENAKQITYFVKITDTNYENPRGKTLWIIYGDAGSGIINEYSVETLKAGVEITYSRSEMANHKNNIVVIQPRR